MASTTLLTPSLVDEEEDVFRDDEDEKVLLENENPLKKTIFGLFIVLGIALSWVLSTQFSQSVVFEADCIYFLMWFSTSFNIVCFPLYFAKSLLVDKQKLSSILSSVSLSKVQLWSFPLFFYMVWAIANYSYTRALLYTSATTVTAIFSSSSAMVFIFSLGILREPFSLIRFFAVVLSIGGILMISLRGNEEGNHLEWIGNALTVLSAVTAALYKVLFKYAVGDANAATVTAILSILGMFNLSIMWTVSMALNALGWEIINLRAIPWGFAVGGSLLSLVFNFLINFGIAYTYPLFISLGTILGIPINGVVDWILRDQSFGILELGGFGLIVVGFLLLLIPYSLRELFNKCSTGGKDRKRRIQTF